MSLEEASGEDRKARLAAIRKKRTAAANGHESKPLHGPEILEKDEVPPSASIKSNESINKEPIAEQITIDSEEATRPTISIDTDDTVEAIALRLQQEILHRAQENATDLSFDIKPEQKPDTKVFTADLKSDIEVHLNKAQFRTNKAINQLLQERYSSELPN